MLRLLVTITGASLLQGFIQGFAQVAAFLKGVFEVAFKEL
jgi:hypothetical protein